MEAVANGGALFFVCAYATTLVADRRPTFAFALAGLGCSFAAFAVAAHPSLRDVHNTGVLHVAAYGAGARALGVFTAFASAYVLCALILACVLVAHARGFVAYAPDRAAFVVTRSAFYAFLRALGALLRREFAAAYTPSVDRLVLLGLATAETLLMVAVRDASYPREHLATYALLKTAVFACVPLLEDVVRE